MSELANFVYCLNAERRPLDDGKQESLNAIGILSVITPEFIPGMFSFSIVFSVQDVDPTKENSVRIVFSREGAEAPQIDSGDIVLPTLDDPDKIGLPKEYKGLNLSMDLRNVVFENEGIYFTDVYFNQQKIGRKNIYAKARRRT